MSFVHETPQFAALLDQVSDHVDVDPALVEKDYSVRRAAGGSARCPGDVARVIVASRRDGDEHEARLDGGPGPRSGRPVIPGTTRGISFRARLRADVFTQVEPEPSTRGTPTPAHETKASLTFLA